MTASNAGFVCLFYWSHKPCSAKDRERSWSRKYNHWLAWICNLNESIMSTDKIVTTGPSSFIPTSNGNIFRVTGHLCGELTGDKGQWSFDVFFNLRPNKRLNKQSWGWWFETLSRPLWRHCKDICLHHIYYIPILPKTFELTGFFFFFFFFHCRFNNPHN